MKRYRILTSILAVAAIAGLFFALNPSPPPTGPNILLIVVDTLRADRLEGTRDGKPIMPGLSAFAEDSMNFLAASTPCTWTKPAMASVFTSLHFDAHKVYFSVDPSSPEATEANALPPSLLTMAEYLKGNEYETGAIQTNGNMSSDFGFDRGFDRYDFFHDHPAEGITDKAITMMEEWSGPFFQYVHYIDPHNPYDPPQGYDKYFGPAPVLDDAEQAYVREQYMDYFWDAIYKTLGIKDSREIPPLSDAGKEAVRTLYDGEVRYADEEVSRLLSHVKKNHPDTLIIFISDHGEEFWERGSMGHGLTMYEEQLHVPFLLHGPGIEPIRVEAGVSTLDILPTVASYLGLEPKKFWQGRNLLDAAEAAAVPVFSKTRAAEPRSNIDLEAVVFDGYKYIVDAVSNKQFLYNLKNDPGELHNLLKEEPDIASDLAQRLKEQHAQDIELGEALRSTETSGKLSSELLEQLKNLGYVGD